LQIIGNYSQIMHLFSAIHCQLQIRIIHAKDIILPLW